MSAVAVATLAAAFNLRMALVAVGPVLADIQADTGARSFAAGLLVTVPILCMSAFAFCGGPVLRRLGARRVVAWCLALIAVGTAARALVLPPWGLVVATIPIGVGMALAGVALPAIVKRHFPARGGLLTGGYVASMGAGAALITLTVVPLAEVLGGWRPAFAASSLAAVGALCAWLLSPVGDERPAPPVAGRRRVPLRIVALLALIFGLQSIPFSSLISWVAAVYRDAGWDAAHAAVTAAAIAVIAIPASAVVPGLSDGRDRRPWLVATAVLVAAGVLGVALAPTTAPWLWLSLFALGNGALFPLALSLPLDHGRDPGEVVALTTWMLGIGYLISAVGPVAVGALRDASGGFALPLGIVASSAALAGLLALCLPAARPPAVVPA